MYNYKCNVKLFNKNKNTFKKKTKFNIKSKTSICIESKVAYTVIRTF